MIPVFCLVHQKAGVMALCQRNEEGLTLCPYCPLFHCILQVRSQALFGPGYGWLEKCNDDFARNTGQASKQLPLPCLPAVSEDEWFLVNRVFTESVTEAGLT